MADEPGLSAELEEEAYSRLCDEVSLHLRLGRLTMAEAAVRQLLERWPERTTAQERAGDLALAQGKIASARQHYRRALELEPANADAERKYGLALVTLTADERRRELINAVVADPNEIGGRYCEDCGLAPPSDDPLAATGVRPYAQDPVRARELWALSERLVSESFSLS